MPSCELPKGFVTVYADASHRDGVFGWACYLKAEWGRIELCGECPDQIRTVNHAEAYAIAQGIYKATRLWSIHGIKGFYIRSDSTVAIRMLRDGNEGGEIGSRLKASIEKHAARLPINWGWVKGHQGQATVRGWVNHRVDQLAKMARHAAELRRKSDPG